MKLIGATVDSLVRTKELEVELCRLEDQMWEGIKLEADSVCRMFEVSSTEQVCFTESTEQVLWTNLRLTHQDREQFRDSDLTLEKLGGARPKASVPHESRLPANADMQAFCYPANSNEYQGFRAVFLIRYQQDVMWAWASPVADENWAAIANRCNELNEQFEELRFAYEPDSGPKEALAELSDIVGVLIACLGEDGAQLRDSDRAELLERLRAISNGNFYE